jgi:trigger factor
MSMQVVQKSGDGLSRVYGVRIGAAELGEKLEARIREITPRLNLKGFRPGKVPAAHVRRVYGKALMGEVVEQTLNETSQQVLTDNGLRVAAQPDLKPESDMEAVIAGREDLAYELNVEVMPDFEPMDVSTLQLERPVYTPTSEELDEAVADLAKQNRTYEDRSGKKIKAQDGDQVTLDFLGRIDGEAFEGGTAEDAQLVLGEGRFIPGFEEQLVGAAPGADVTVNVTFPEDYPVERLKGQAAEFEVKVKAVKAPVEAQADDALAERLGMGDLEALKNALKVNLEGQYSAASRMKVKRALLDQLDTSHDFGLPPRMVEAEFGGIWAQVEADRERGELAPEDQDKSEDELKAEYRKIAERRVRLGLVLAEIGRRNNIQVSDQELAEAMRQEALRYGPQAQAIFDMLRQNANAQAQMRAPIYEDKVVDLILSQAAVTEKPVTREALLAEDELPEGYGAAKPADESPAAEAAPKPKKRSAKAKAVEPESAEAAAPAPAEAAEGEAAAKPKPAKKSKKAQAAAPADEAAPEDPAGS